MVQFLRISGKLEPVKTYASALIIDDDVDLCVLLKTLLGNSIPQVVYVHNIQSGREFISKNHPEVIFLDNNLPDGQGVKYLAELRSFSPGSLLVVMSALSASKAEAIEKGADIFVEKPLTISNVSMALGLTG